MVPGGDIVAEEQGWVLQTYTKAACPLNAAVLAYPAPTRYDECVTWNARVMQELTRSGPDMVIATASASYTAVLSDEELVEGPDAYLLMAQGYADSWEELVSAGVRVAMLEDSPRPGIDVAECLSLNTDDPGQCAFPREAALQESSPMNTAAAGMGGVHVVDLNDYVCPDQECQMVIGGLVVYRDLNHLTASYAATLAPMLQRALGDSVSAG
ncbi:MAG: SGNH hydrolase domain-containing protein [Ornithinimicrobium sp.]